MHEDQDPEKEPGPIKTFMTGWGQWILLAILFIVVGWPLIVEFTK